MRKRLINVALILIAFLLTCIAVWTGPYFDTALAVVVGYPSPIRVVATRRVENPVATERNRADAAERALNLPMSTLHDPSIDQDIYNNLYHFFDMLDYVRLGYDMWFHDQELAYEQSQIQWQTDRDLWEQHLIQRAQMIEAGIAEEDIEGPIQPSSEFVFDREDFPLDEHFEPLTTHLSHRLSHSQKEFLLSLTEEEHNDLQDAIFLTAEHILETPRVAITEVVLLEIQQYLEELTYIVDFIQVGYVILSEIIVPNMVFDPVGDAGRREASAADYDVVYLMPNQIIVDENEIITEEAYAIMGALGMLEAEWTRALVPMVGIAWLVALTILACCWFIYFYRQRMISRTKEALLLFTLYTSVIIVLWVLDGVGYYLMPILVFTMLIAMLIDSRTAITLNLGFTLIAFFVVGGDLPYIIFFMLSGSLICLLARYTTERSKIMIVALFVAFFNFVLSVAITFAFEPHQALYSWRSIMVVGVYAAVNGILTVIIAVGSLPLWEVIFGVVTPIKLLDLTNPTNPLMRRLTIEAPGTYHHSLIVANLAESAAYDIGANPHIARAGGYYHDIGKLKYPQYFAENIQGVNPHDDMDPVSSAQIISSHISYGLTLAAEYRLPQFLRDIIHEHHGTSLIKFFYAKARENENPDDPDSLVKEEDYRYPFTIPQSRESAVVMLADGVEAAVRSMMAQGKDMGDMKELINKMIKDKLTDGSLADSKLSIRDVDTIVNSFYRVLKGMYHERIPYPQEINGEVVMSRR